MSPVRPTRARRRVPASRARRHVPAALLASLAAVALAAPGCGDGIALDLDDEGPPEVAGNYAIAFTILETMETIFGFEGCADLIEVGSTQAVLEVTQDEDVVTLGFGELGLPIRSDLMAPITPDGTFFFDGQVIAGPVHIPNQPTPVDVAGSGMVDGNIDGRSGELDLQFDVGAVSCAFRGTIVGQRS